MFSWQKQKEDVKGSKAAVGASGLCLAHRCAGCKCWLLVVTAYTVSVAQAAAASARRTTKGAQQRRTMQCNNDVSAYNGRRIRRLVRQLLLMRKKKKQSVARRSEGKMKKTWSVLSQGDHILVAGVGGLAQRRWLMSCILRGLGKTRGRRKHSVHQRQAYPPALEFLQVLVGIRPQFAV